MQFDRGRFSKIHGEAKVRTSPTFARCGVLLVFGFCLATRLRADAVLPALATNLVCYYDFDHPVSGNPAKEDDLGFSSTDINLINGGAAMRTNDGAYPGSTFSLQTKQVSPTNTSNDDWKAGIYQTNGVASLTNFSSVAGITLMGWVKPTGTNPNLDTTTSATNDYYNAIGLFGLLSGTSEGHAVRALLEIMDVSGTMRLVALGRRIDTGNSLTLAATNDWHALLPSNTWAHLTATFDFDNGAMSLYRNGEPIPANYTAGGDPWAIIGGAEPDLTSPTSPSGIKIGGSYPQNSQEKNPFNGRFDDLMFFNKVLTPAEVLAQYENFTAAQSPPSLSVNQSSGQITLQWPLPSAEYSLESNTNVTTDDWQPVNQGTTTNDQQISVTLPATNREQYFRLKKP
jgi:hypothetical protein